MFDILQKLLFLRKATKDHIQTILEKEKFVYTQETIDGLLKGNQKGVRYGNVVLEREENGVWRKRFFKVVIDGTLRTYRLFRRQVEITDALHKDKHNTFPNIAVIAHSFETPVPYAIFETREQGETFGFMHDSSAFYETFKEDDMNRLVEAIYSFHKAGQTFDVSIWKYTRPISSSLTFYIHEAHELLTTKIKHKTKDGVFVENTVDEILSKTFALEHVEKHVAEIFTREWQKVIASQAERKNYLVHADMQIDNVYRHPDNTFELIDFEWVGKSDNPVVAIMYDYGNLRARAWSSPNFQALLDTAMLEHGVKHYDASIVKSGITLGKLRSSLMMSRFHLDYHNTVKKDKRTEEDYNAMYPKTLSSLESVLRNSA
ncbi:MAG: hypothetical protein QG653_507 [Patescibacteria group bacterium]|nr:hypothetical protein [Patescibacteria group bacterium]